MSIGTEGSGQPARIAIAERLAHDGATVVVNYGKSADKAEQVVAGIEAKRWHGRRDPGRHESGA
jgi:NAD(P)-dependent dehydrogenase (short-subunit alcohol dehydrogenase family)